MRTSTGINRRTFAPSLLLHKLLRKISSGWTGSSQRDAAEKSISVPLRHQGFMLEAIEPRLLLSADISYATDLGNAAGLEMQLQAVTSGSDIYLNLYKTSDATLITSKLLGAGDLTGADLNVNIMRDSSGSVGDAARAFAADTLHVDASTLSALSGLSGFTGDLGLLFTGGLQSFGSQDHVEINNSGSLGHNFKLESDCAITVDSGASLTATGHDLTLAATETNSALGISDHNFIADATHASVTVLGDLDANNITLG
jgi:hypothetical protein